MDGRFKFSDVTHYYPTGMSKENLFQTENDDKIVSSVQYIDIELCRLKWFYR